MLDKLNLIKKVSENIERKIDSFSPMQVKQQMDLIGVADIADIINSIKSRADGLRLFSLVSNGKKGEVLVLLNRQAQKKILKEIPDKKLIEIVNQLDSDDAVDLLSEISFELRKKILSKIEPEHALNITNLIKYPADSAGGIMQAEFPSIQSNTKIKDALHFLQNFENIETARDVFVIDENQKYAGMVNVWALISTPHEETVNHICAKNAVVVDAFMDQENVAEVFKKYDATTLGVVNYENKLIGQITIDDIVDVIDFEVQEDMMKMAGVTDAENIFDQTVFSAIKSRFFWLASALFGWLISGLMLWKFRQSMESVILLAVFIPVVMGAAGNVATQSSTVMVRCIALGGLERRKISAFILKEAGVGLGIGLSSALLVASFAFLFQKAYLLGLLVGVSMFFSILTAAIIGALAPIIFKKLNVDPAIAAGPIVLTINDLTALLIYFSIVSQFIDLLKT